MRLEQHSHHDVLVAANTASRGRPLTVAEDGLLWFPENPALSWAITVCPLLNWAVPLTGGVEL
jgi:hypothetical protein